jgi:hypothetical protein
VVGCKLTNVDKDTFANVVEDGNLNAKQGMRNVIQSLAQRVPSQALQTQWYFCMVKTSSSAARLRPAASTKLATPVYLCQVTEQNTAKLMRAIMCAKVLGCPRNVP